jgi:Zn-dependent metalloprotease
MSHDHIASCTGCGFLPPYVIRHLAESDDPAVRRIAFATTEATAVGRTMRMVSPALLLGRSTSPGLGRRRTVYDMQSRYSPMPGELRRKEGQHATGQSEVDEAYENAGTTHAFYKNILKRESLDGMGFALNSSVNYGVEVVNAFWDGERMVYGAGDGKLFLPFTRSLGIAAHEMSHGVLSFTSNLEYQGQPGALNESFCDVMGISVEQHASQKSAADGNWFMGGDVVGPALKGLRGFRSFSDEPAYVNHPLLGTDPQPKHMNGFVNTSEDNGGVHMNSGIPNHAFYLAARALGGNVWDRATKIWYDAFTDVLNKRATFRQAAQATQASARRLYGDAAATTIADAWRAVGIDPEGRT